MGADGSKGCVNEEPAAEPFQQASSPAFPNWSAAKGSSPGPSLSHLLILLQQSQAASLYQWLQNPASLLAPPGRCWVLLGPPVSSAAVAMEIPISPAAWVFSLGAILLPSTAPFAYPGIKQGADREENCFGMRLG